MEEGLATVKTSSNERLAAIQQQLAQQEIQNKDQDTAFLIELLGGIFGFLGIGYIYSGLTNAGLVRLVALWIVQAIVWTFVTMLMAVLIGFCLLPVPFVINIAAGYISAKELKESIIAVKSAGGATGGPTA